MCLTIALAECTGQDSCLQVNPFIQSQKENPAKHENSGSSTPNSALLPAAEMASCRRLYREPCLSICIRNSMSFMEKRMCSSRGNGSSSCCRDVENSREMGSELQGRTCGKDQRLGIAAIATEGTSAQRFWLRLPCFTMTTVQ